VSKTSNKSDKVAPELDTPTDLPQAAVDKISASLNVLLADAFALYMKTKNFHWHVSGPHFRDYHLLLDEQGDQIFATIDPIAERARKVGGTTLRSVGHVSKLQRILDNDADYVTPLDMLAELRRHGRMTPLGVFSDRAREVTIEQKRGITLSREDASNLAHSKAANACGQAILLRHLGIEPGDLDHTYLAGGFANYINVRNAIEIGFLAPVPENRIVKIGNASLHGARRMLLSRERRAAAERLVRSIEHVELETTPDFFEIFVEGCQFKPMQIGGGK
jgi:DNA-binding ferritin-like protein